MHAYTLKLALVEEFRQSRLSPENTQLIENFQVLSGYLQQTSTDIL